ncbi:hypothetical protein JSQ81_13955 [Sporosarcina sp. Marseille-Q4063]|uniref:hypothetical protein n=1 Tax=Sporosarcina sp. Marseille-Q4063 TaxID=2810514 RepID=UPI001BB01D88|nr:hypothetical protein [Sporosarcina sp. Marseille-Q4063]QUW20914.1 hypothetical protein JSQ81_13955 [Sporosarcina sp. Marseille-Q4063]
MIPQDALKHFENAIYLPMLIKILEMDLLTIENTQLKFKRPYAKMIDQALLQARSDLKETNIYLRRNNMKLIKYSSNENFTEFIFSGISFEERKKYSSGELKEGTEEIMSEYLGKFET